jgi:hypothetical protein
VRLLKASSLKTVADLACRCRVSLLFCSRKNRDTDIFIGRDRIQGTDSVARRNRHAARHAQYFNEDFFKESTAERARVCLSGFLLCPGIEFHPELARSPGSVAPRYNKELASPPSAMSKHTILSIREEDYVGKG